MPKQDTSKNLWKETFLPPSPKSCHSCAITIPLHSNIEATIPANTTISKRDQYYHQHLILIPNFIWSHLVYNIGLASPPSQNLKINCKSSNITINKWNSSHQSSNPSKVSGRQVGMVVYRIRCKSDLIWAKFSNRNLKTK